MLIDLWQAQGRCFCYIINDILSVNLLITDSLTLLTKPNNNILKMIVYVKSNRDCSWKALKPKYPTVPATVYQDNVVRCCSNGCEIGKICLGPHKPSFDTICVLPIHRKSTVLPMAGRLKLCLMQIIQTYTCHWIWIHFELCLHSRYVFKCLSNCSTHEYPFTEYDIRRQCRQ